MGLLDQLLSGGDDRNRFDDFSRRYDQGRPDEGYDDDEVRGHYGQVDREVDDDTYRSSARDAFERMDPRERREFKEQLRGAARERGYDDLDRDGDGIPDDAEGLAQYTTRARRQDPDLLGSLLGGAGGTGGGMGSTMGGLGGILGGAAGAGALGSVLGSGSGGRGGGALGNPIARAALAGIATMAVRRMTQR